MNFIQKLVMLIPEEYYSFSVWFTLLVCILDTCGIISTLCVLIHVKNKYWKGLTKLSEIVEKILRKAVTEEARSLQDNQKRMAMQTAFQRQLMTKMQQQFQDILIRSKMGNDVTTLKDNFKKVMDNKERDLFLINQKIDTIIEDISAIARRMEIKNKYLHEKSIQTDVKSQVMTFLVSPKRKIIKQASFKEGSPSLNRSIASIVKKSLTEFREEENISLNAKRDKENELVDICSDLQTQILQASSTLKGMMEKSFGEVSDGYAKAIHCITVLHEDNTQRVLDRLDSNKECLTYLYLTQEKTALELHNKIDILMNANQVILKELTNRKRQNQGIMPKATNFPGESSNSSKT